MNHPRHRRGILQGLVALPIAGSGAVIGTLSANAEPAAAGLEGDALLLALGRQFEELRQRYEATYRELEALEITDVRLQSLDDEAEELGGKLQLIMHDIARIKCNTSAGQRIKLLAWEHCQYAVGENVEYLIETECTNDRLGLSILRDLMAQHGIEQRQLNFSTPVMP